MNKILLRRLLAIVLLCSLAGRLPAQTIRYVKQGGAGDGSNWANASGDFQGMINASSAGDEVWVAAGDFQTPEDAPFSMKEGVEIFGGFPNTGSPAWNDRDWTTYITRLLGQQRGGFVEGNRVIGNNNNGLTAAAMLDGFTISNGAAPAFNHGGGMYNNNVSPTIQNCIFSNNTAGEDGGAIYNWGAHPTIINCTFSNNQAGYRNDGNGGGIANYYSNPIVTNCLFLNNKTLLGGVNRGGGGMYNEWSNAMVTNCRFTGNHAYTGGGVYNEESSPQFRNTHFSGNSAVYRGGGIRNYGETTSPTYINCSFTNNISPKGGGVANQFYATVTFVNCLFYGNASNNGLTGEGGGIFNEVSISNITNCTFVENTASAYGGAICSVDYFKSFQDNLVIRNSIIHGNNSGIYMSQNRSLIHYSLVQSYTPNGGTVAVNAANNIDGTTNPLFVNATDPVGPDGDWGTPDDGLRLQDASPVVNMGNNAAIPAEVVTDLAGAARIQGSTVDMGVYESEFILNCAYSTLYVDGNISGSGEGGTWSTAFKTLSEAMERARNCPIVNSILVAKGTYYPTGTQNGNNRDSTFLIPQRGGIKIYGGYPNGGGTRDPITNPTILSGNIDNLGDNSDNSYHIIVMTETLPGADSVVIDGFALTRANANGNQYYYHNTLTLQNEGGAILLRKNSNIGTKIAIRNCNIINNISIVNGAGIYSWQASPLISNCVIVNNNTAGDGAGIFSLDASPYVTNCVFSNNTANHGAGIYSNAAAPTIVNSSFSGNTAAQGSSIYNTGTSNATVVNTILWNNGTDHIHNTATLHITYSNVEQGSGVYSGTGNINADPLFVNASNPAGPDGIWRTSDDGLKLQSGSSCVNAGTPDIAGLQLNPNDLQESKRVQSDKIDMGAYESPYTRCDELSNVLYVDASVSGSGKGNSWNSALKTLTEALDLTNFCANINTILVAQGTYYPTSPSGRDATFLIPRRGAIKIYGGYPTGGGTRDIIANPTILSGDMGTPGNNEDNSYHVMVIANADANADSVIIDGFTFTNANANGGGSFTLNDLALARNTGGGLLLAKNNNNSKLAIRNCRFENNKANQGAGIFITASSPGITNTYLQGNFSSDNGGGISNYDNAAPVLINVLITGNRANYGGGVFNDNSSPAFINTTIAGNYAFDAGGMYNRYSNSNVSFRNSILYGNRRADGSPSNIFNTADGKAVFAYSLIESASEAWEPGFGTNNGNNLFIDPLFVNHVNPTSTNTPSTSGDYQLQSTSPVIDAGNDTLLPSDINWDIVNAVRSQQAALDMGAFESPYFNCDMFTVDTSQTNVKCYGDAIGEAAVSVRRGVAPYTYSWSNGAQTASINNLVAGNYTCTVTDANGCSITKQFTITQPATLLSTAITAGNILCFGANNDSATIHVTGGMAPYIYNWSNGGSAESINALAAGTYSCTVIDANGCSITENVSITQPIAPLSATTSETDVLCYNNNTGAGSVLVSGGTAPYSYL